MFPFLCSLHSEVLLAFLTDVEHDVGNFQFSAVATPRVSSTSFLVVSPVVTLLLCSGFILLSDVYVRRCANAQKLVNTGVL